MNKNTTGIPVTTEMGYSCGYIRGTRFDRKFDPGRHILKQPYPALALEVFVLDQLKGKVETILFFDGKGKEYRCSLDHFLTKGERFKPAGWPEQVRLALSGFSQVRRGEAIQLGMFA